MMSPIVGTGIDPSSRFNAGPSSDRAHAYRASNAGSQDHAAIHTAADGIKVLRARLDEQFSQASGYSPSTSARDANDAFKPPSATDVANRVLGFIQARLQKEAGDGADTERLASLLDQARSGVEKGFSEARKQIAALGLMNDQLGQEIDNSFGRIQDGLNALGDRFLAGSPAVADVPDASVSAVQVETASRQTFSFDVKTRDGDRVTIRMDEQRYGSASVAAAQRDNGTALQASSSSVFAGRYQFTVSGELDTGERNALSALVSDVQSVSDRFFDGDVQGAFQAAQSLNIDGGELASFSLNLSSARSVRASAYEAVAPQPSASQPLRPLGSLAQAVQDTGREAQRNGLDPNTLNSLMSRLLDDMQSVTSEPAQGRDQNDITATRSLMDSFLTSLLDRLNQQS